jgi:putative hydrolase of the HAD superfamily
MIPPRQSTSHVRFVLFDAVGTLIRVQPAVADIYRRVGIRHGSRLTVEQIGRGFGESFARHQSCAPTNEDCERGRWRKIVAEVLHDIPHAAEAVFEELWKLFAEPEQWALFHDVEPVWTELQRRGFVLGIASNFDMRLQPICQALPPLDGSAHYFVSSEIGFPKPHLEFYRCIERELNAEPAEILLVGDSLVQDVAGALAAGWQAIHIDRELDERDERSIGSLGELLTRF